MYSNLFTTGIQVMLWRIECLFGSLAIIPTGIRENTGHIYFPRCI
jgi:hypothetical protein